MTLIFHQSPDSSIDHSTLSLQVLHRSTPVVLLLALMATQVASAANWPGWRGPNGDGTAPNPRKLPETWSKEKNIRWKQELPAWSGSTPMVWGDKIFLNPPSREEVKPAEPAPASEPGRPQARKRPGASRGLGMEGPGGQ